MLLPGLSVLGLYVVFVVFLVIMIVFVAVYLSATPYPRIRRESSEEVFFVDAERRRTAQFQFGLLKPDDGVDLSVVIPAFNEEERLPPMLDEALAHLSAREQQSRGRFSYEVLVVDDGSSDTTAQVALRYTAQYGAERVRVLVLAANRGKGGAVRMGMLSSRGRLVLFADADGATCFADVDKLEHALSAVKPTPEGAAIACGSRAHLERESIAQRSLFRTLLMKAFHAVVWLFAVRSVRDTQCGFKLLTRPAMLLCFANLHVERWAFDAELLYIAEHLNIPITEVAVKWTEISGSKLTPVISWLEMGFDLFSIWLRYLIGVWRLRPHIDVKKAE